MWIIIRTGFVSCVEHTSDSDLIRVRARRREHLADTFELFDADIIDLGENAPDYRWHADVPRVNVAQALYDAALNLNYTSHVKEEVSGADDEMYRAMLACWTALHRLQNPVEPDTDWWTPGSTAAYGQWEPGDRHADAIADWRAGDDITEQASRIAGAMLDSGSRPRLTVRVWEGDEDECLICGHDLNTGDPYVILPEDAEYDEPPGPAHLECAEDDGWKVQ